MLISLQDHSCEEYRYTAFGEETPSQSLSSNPWRFSSKRTDSETGLSYFGRRYHFPSYGRWLTQDPLGLTAGPNLYAFVSNAPLTHVDLYGLLDTKAAPINFRQMGIGADHGVGSFGLHTASAFSTHISIR